jgi:hypothetical protein
VAFCAGTRQVNAALTTFEFTGTVTQVNLDPGDPFNGTIGFGTPFSGFYTFESTTPDSVLAPSTGSYIMSGTSTGMRINIGGNIFSTVDFLAVGIANNFAGPVDQYTVFAEANSGNLEIELFFQDGAATVFSNDALPLTPPPMANFAMRTFSLIALANSNQVQIDGNIDTLSLSTPVSVGPVAVPAITECGMVALMMLLGLGALYCLRKQKMEPL